MPRGGRRGSREDGQLSWTLTLADTARPSLIEGGPGCLSLLAEWARGVREQRRRLVVVGDARVLDLWGTRILAALGDDALARAAV